MNQENSILLNEQTSDEFERFGKLYYDEAKRILTHMPRLPKKYGPQIETNFGYENEFSQGIIGGTRLLLRDDQTKLSTE